MAKGKTIFTKQEVENIKSLIDQLGKSDSQKQKGIRAKIRKIGLYWSEVGKDMPYTVANFEKLFVIGILKMRNGSQVETSPSSKEPNIQRSVSEVTAFLSNTSKGRSDSDEYYVIDLCDEILGEKALRQAKFDFLKGDTGMLLPVDAYYPKRNLVIEYYERQHTESVKLFDKKMTASGVTRDVQRRIYDERRKIELPKHGIQLVIISYNDFGSSKRLKRLRNQDLDVVRNILKDFISDNE